MSRHLCARATLLAVAGALAVVAAPSAQTRLDLNALLKSYSAGRFDETIRTIQRAGDSAGHDLREQWGAARPWIEADPGDRRRRYLAVAALALETEMLRAERNDWAAPDSEDCAGRCVLDWASVLILERGAPDEAERLWFQAAVALAGGVRDWTFLVAPNDGRQPFGLGSGLLTRALARFPGDPRFRLDRAVTVASRFSVTTDGEGRSPVSSALPIVRVFPDLPEFSRSQRQAVLAAAIGELSALAADPSLGSEARVRLGYLHWATGNDAAARPELAAAAEAASDPDLRYLANFLIGMTAQARGDTGAAIAAFDAALQARPHSESAALTRAALALQQGDAERAYTLAREPLTTLRGDVDPWRQYLYGRYPQLPSLVARLRAEVTR